MGKKDITKISGAILTSFINLHYLEEIDRLNVVRHCAKKNLRRTINDLKDIEVLYYNQVEKVDEDDLSDKLTANTITFIDYLLNEFDFNDFTKFQQIAYSFKLEPNRIGGLSDKILKEHNNIS